MTKNQSDIEKIVIRAISSISRRNISEIESLPINSDFLADGIIDSIGYLDLISEIEETVNIEIDLSLLDENDMTSISGLARHIKLVSKKDRV